MHSLRIRSFGLIACRGRRGPRPWASPEAAQAYSPVGEHQRAGNHLDTTTPGGPFTQGDTLTLTPGTYTGVPTPTVTEQWMDCGRQPSTSCAPDRRRPTDDQADLHRRHLTDIRVDHRQSCETATNTDATTLTTTTITQTSPTVGPIAGQTAAQQQNCPRDLPSTHRPGRPDPDERADHSRPPRRFLDRRQWAPDDVHQWLRRDPTGTASPTSTNAPTYALTAADVGNTIEVQRRPPNTAGTTTPATSPPDGDRPRRTTSRPNESPVPSGSGPHSPRAPRFGMAPKPRRRSSGAGATAAASTARTSPVPRPGRTRHTDTDVGATMQVAETATNAGGTSTTRSPLSPTRRRPRWHRPDVPAATLPTSPDPTVGPHAHRLRGSVQRQPRHVQLPVAALQRARLHGDSGRDRRHVHADQRRRRRLDRVRRDRQQLRRNERRGAVLPHRHHHRAEHDGAADELARPTAGQGVTLIASVSSPAGSIKPAGTVEFDANGSAIPGCAGLAIGATGPTEICQTSFSASTQYVTAVYSAAPGTFVNGSGSSPTTLTVGKAATTVTVAASAHVTLGSKTTYTASVHPPAGSSLTPTGSVTFMDGGKTIKGCGNKL